MPELLDVSGKCHCCRTSLNGLAQPDMIIACHCTDCQTFSGAPFRAVVIMKPENIVIKGDEVISDPYYAEIENIEKGGPIAMADYLVNNSKNIEDSLVQLRSILDELGVKK